MPVWLWRDKLLDSDFDRYMRAACVLVRLKLCASLFRNSVASCCLSSSQQKARLQHACQEDKALSDHDPNQAVIRPYITTSALVRPFSSPVCSFFVRLVLDTLFFVSYSPIAFFDYTSYFF